MYTVCLVAGPLIGGIAGGYIAYNVSLAYVFWVGTALSAVTFVSTVFLVPETLYFRDDSSGRPRQEEASGTTKEVALHLEQTTTTRTDYRPYTFARSLGFAKPPGAWLHHFVQPWRTLALPGTWVVMLHYGGLVGGIVTISTIGPQLVAAPPYLWAGNAGLINVGPLIGSILGAVYTYLLADARLRSQARHESHGFAEPESRLPTMFPALAIATAGFWVFGFCAQNPSPTGWVGLQVGYGMISFGLMQVPSIGFNYVSLNSKTTIMRDPCLTYKPTVDRCVLVPCRRLFRHGDHPARYHRVCVDVFRVGMDCRGRRRRGFWHLWYAHGNIWSADHSTLAVWKEDENRHCFCLWILK